MIRPRAQEPRKVPAKSPVTAVVRATLKTAAAAAAAILALAGCKPLATTSAPVPAAPAVPTQSGPLYTEPAAGFSPVYHLIKHARHYIDLTMYELSDTTAAHDLAGAAGRGVTVKVILDRREKSHNSPAFAYLKSHGVRVIWSRRPSSTPIRRPSSWTAPPPSS